MSTTQNYQVRYRVEQGQGLVPGAKTVRANSWSHAETIVRRSTFGIVHVDCVVPMGGQV